MMKTCSEALESCREALDARKVQAERCTVVLGLVSGENTDLNKELDYTKSQLASPIHNPFIMGAVGVVLGILVTGYALRK